MQAKKKSNDLSDIVLEKDSKKVANTKKWLLTAASAILLFLIVLVVMKMLNRHEGVSQEPLANAGNSLETLAPTSSQKATPEAEASLFKKEPILNSTSNADASDTDLKFDEMVRKLKEQDQVNTPPKEEAKKETLTTEIQEVKPPIVEVVQDTKTEEITPPAPTKKETVSKKVATQSPVAQAPQPATDAAAQQTATPAATLSGYFIQVGATAKAFPDKKFLRKVKKSGFDYIVHSVTIQGKALKKVLVGPYKSREDATKALAVIKANINPSAYVYRIK